MEMETLLMALSYPIIFSKDLPETKVYEKELPALVDHNVGGGYIAVNEASVMDF